MLDEQAVCVRLVPLVPRAQSKSRSWKEQTRPTKGEQTGGSGERRGNLECYLRLNLGFGMRLLQCEPTRIAHAPAIRDGRNFRSHHRLHGGHELGVTLVEQAQQLRGEVHDALIPVAERCEPVAKYAHALAQRARRAGAGRHGSVNLCSDSGGL